MREPLADLQEGLCEMAILTGGRWSTSVSLLALQQGWTGLPDTYRARATISVSIRPRPGP
ncbi:hypothetical protein ACEUZ9_000750 [Paracoccus litorisediminis]|uniref:hypothetical protein n=1 Tax=Paracoccus litorisediminis TaxID=2006130 RepID=UPI00373264F1